MPKTLTFHPVTPDRWDDLVQLFSAHGNPNYCWCQRWRMPSAEYRDAKSADRKAALEDSVQGGTPVGILGYLDGQPVGWCSVAPRTIYQALERARTIKKIDERETWSIVCLFLAPAIQGQGYSEQFIAAAADYAKASGAEVVEAYPVDPVIAADGSRQAANYRFMGYTASYLRAGFKDVTPDGASRRIMRQD
jgi:GNAT superfamily N-acetyltransferase